MTDWTHKTMDESNVLIYDMDGTTCAFFPLDD